MSEHFLEVYGTNFEYLRILPAHLYYFSTRVFIKSKKWAKFVCYFQEICKEE